MYRIQVAGDLKLMKKFFIFSLAILIVITNVSCAKTKSAFHFDTNKLKVALVIRESLSDSSRDTEAYSGLKRFETDYGAGIAVVEKVGLEDAKAVFAELVEKKFNLILANGYEYGKILKRRAKMYPDTFFCVIGGETVQEPNLCSFGFKDEQYGYLIGAVAGLNTSTNKVGIIVGDKIPPIERTIIGMRNGLKSVNPKADLVVSYINSFNDINKGKEAAISQINTGVDVITHLADQSGIGVIKAAEESDTSVIGAVIDQHDLAPSTVITSGIQDVSQLVYLACQYYVEEALEPVIFRFGLKNQVIDLTPSYGNIDPTTESRINRVKSTLIDQEVRETQDETTKKNKK